MSIRTFAVALLMGSAMAPVARAAAFDPAQVARIDAYLEAELSRGDIPGAALVLVEGDRIVHVRGFGRATPSGSKVMPSTPFKLGSVSKSITAVAVAELVEDGRVALDAPVRRYLPWFRVGDSGASDRITVRELLTHTSGLSTLSGLNSTTSDDSLERAVRELSSKELVHEPGEHFEYSNANYQTLGAIIEAVSGLPFSAFVGQRIFGPLGMSASFAGAGPALAHGGAMGSRYWFGHCVAVPIVASPRSLEPSGELYASAEDMGKFLGALLGGGQRAGTRILSAEAARALFIPMARTPSGDGYAMGWRVAPQTYSFNVWHDGATPDFHAHAALDFASRRGFALLVNSETFLSGPKVGDLALQVLRILRGDAPLPVRRSSLPTPLLCLIVLALFQLIAFAWWLPKARRTTRRAGWVRVTLPFVMHVGAAIALVVGVPRLNHATFPAAMAFAPDGAVVLAANGMMAAAWACVRLAILSCRRRG